jgi:hypothetical protein
LLRAKLADAKHGAFAVRVLHLTTEFRPSFTGTGYGNGRSRQGAGEERHRDRGISVRAKFGAATVNSGLSRPAPPRNDGAPSAPPFSKCRGSLIQRLSPRSRQDGAPMYFISTHLDLADRRRSPSLLRRPSGLYRALLGSRRIRDQGRAVAVHEPVGDTASRRPRGGSYHQFDQLRARVTDGLLPRVSERIRVVGNGIEDVSPPGRSRRKNREIPIVLFSGRFVDRKGSGSS